MAKTLIPAPATKHDTTSAKAAYRPFGTYRFLLATLVLASHSSDLLPKSNLLGTLALGNVGVMLFFVLSGFVISEALDAFYEGKILKFAANRAMKIVPAYWVILAISFAVWAMLDHPAMSQLDARTIVGNIILMGGYLGITKVNIISIAWAVQIEVIFYILIAILAWVIWRLPRQGAVLGIAGTVVLSLYVFVWWGGHETRFFGFFQFGPYFGLGVTVYLLASRGISFVAWSSRRRSQWRRFMPMSFIMDATRR